jgi:hypothetical protein
MPNVDAPVGVRFIEKAQSATFNRVMQIYEWKLEQLGDKLVDLAVEGNHKGSLSLYLKESHQSAATEADSGRWQHNIALSRCNEITNCGNCDKIPIHLTGLNSRLNSAFSGGEGIFVTD